MHYGFLIDYKNCFLKIKSQVIVYTLKLCNNDILQDDAVNNFEKSGNMLLIAMVLELEVITKLTKLFEVITKFNKLFKNIILRNSQPLKDIWDTLTRISPH